MHLKVWVFKRRTVRKNVGAKPLLAKDNRTRHWNFYCASTVAPGTANPRRRGLESKQWLTNLPGEPLASQARCRGCVRRRRLSPARAGERLRISLTSVTDAPLDEKAGRCLDRIHPDLTTDMAKANLQRLVQVSIFKDDLSLRNHLRALPW